MASRRAFLTAAAGVAVLPVDAIGMARLDGQADFLFVQTAKRMRFDPAAALVTLEGVSPVTLFFSDRPERIAGKTGQDSRLVAVHDLPGPDDLAQSLYAGPGPADRGADRASG